MPSPTAAQRHKLNRDPIADPHIVLIEFQEDGQAAVNRAAINTEDIVWGGETYSRAAIDIQLPNTGGDETSATMTASNVDRLLSRALNSATQRVNVRLILVDSSDLTGVPLIDTKNLLVIPSASAKGGEISADLAPRASLLEPIPFKQTTRPDFPGVWLA